MSGAKLDKQAMATLKAYWSIKENMWHPVVRIGGSLTLCGQKVFMFGGYNLGPLNDLQYLEQQTAKWVKVNPQGGKLPPERFGHTTCYY